MDFSGQLEVLLQQFIANRKDAFTNKRKKTQVQKIAVSAVRPRVRS